MDGLGGAGFIVAGVALFLVGRVLAPRRSLPLWVRGFAVVALAVGLASGSVLLGLALLVTGARPSELPVAHATTTAGIAAVSLALQLLTALFFHRQVHGRPASPPWWQGTVMVVGLALLAAGLWAFGSGLWTARG